MNYKIRITLISFLVLFVAISTYGKDPYRDYYEISLSDLSNYYYENENIVPPQINQLQMKKIKLTYALITPLKQHYKKRKGKGKNRSKNRKIKDNLYKKYMIYGTNIPVKNNYNDEIKPNEILIGYLNNRYTIPKKFFDNYLTIFGTLKLEKYYNNYGKLISIYRFDIEDVAVQGTRD